MATKQMIDGCGTVRYYRGQVDSLSATGCRQYYNRSGTAHMNCIITCEARSPGSRNQTCPYIMQLIMTKAYSIAFTNIKVRVGDGVLYVSGTVGDCNLGDTQQILGVLLVENCSQTQATSNREVKDFKNH